MNWCFSFMQDRNQGLNHISIIVVMFVSLSYLLRYYHVLSNVLYRHFLS